jgi:hypothetical protein
MVCTFRTSGKLSAIVKVGGFESDAEFWIGTAAFDSI